MEAWRDELYHAGILKNLRSRLKINSGAGSTIGKKSVSPTGKTSSSGKGREWSNHKYVRKEGNRYIYPEDLKKSKSSSNKKSSISERKENAPHSKWTYYDSDKNSKVDAKRLFRSYGVDGGNTYVKGSARIKMSAPFHKDEHGTRYRMMTSADDHKGIFKYSKKRENEIREAHGDDNKRVMVTRLNSKDPMGSKSDILFSTVEYKNGEKWFKSNISVNYTEETVNKGMIGGTDVRHKVHYTVEYSKFRQGVNKAGNALNKLHNRGKKFINRLKDAGWNKYRSSVDTIGSGHKADEVDSNVEIEWPHDHEGKKK